MTFVVAVTGSVASGKSTIIRYLGDKGVTIISADEINRALLKPQTPTFKAIVEHFGNHVVNQNGFLNKQALRDIIFSDTEEKKWLENLLHPYIRKRIEQQVMHATGPYVLVEIPLLKSKRDFPYINRVLLIDVDYNIQVDRIIQRDHCSFEQAEAVIKNHPPIDEKRKLADDIVHNNGTKDELFVQLETLHATYCKLAACR